MSGTYPFKLHYENDSMFSDHALKRLKESYMREDEKSPQERFAFVATKFASNPEHAERIYNYASKMWLSFATPILSFGRNTVGMPISCFLSYIDDTSESLLDRSKEARALSMLGGGVGMGFGIRPADGKSTGVIAHCKTYDADVIAFRQGKTRRGAIAAYLDVNHPEIHEFITMRDPFGGDMNRKALNIHNAVNFSDDFMSRVKALFDGQHTREEQEELDRWELSHPGNGVKDVTSVKQVWEDTIEARMATGEPYMLFTDTVNKFLPRFQKDLGLKVRQSNLCIEITLPTGIDYQEKNRTAVCCLSSLNISKYDEWKNDDQFVGDVVEFLDNVLTYFITESSKADARFRDDISSAVYSAMMERSIGIGAMGFHDYLQQQGIPFESAMATSFNIRIFRRIKEQASKATQMLALERGACPDYTNWRKWLEVNVKDNEERAKIIAENPPVRNAHVLSIAPNASSGIILNTSPSIEPYRANFYREEGNVGVFFRRNPNLEKVLEKYGKNTPEVWSEIVADEGSVQGLDFLDDNEKDVFKTFKEIDMKWVVGHAAERQEFICQSQSVNLFFLPTAPIEYVSMIHLMAWQAGLKSLYYMRSDTAAKVSSLSKRIQREKIADARSVLASEDICVACEG